MSQGPHASHGLASGTQHSGGLAIGLDHQSKNLGSNSNLFKNVHSSIGGLKSEHDSGNMGDLNSQYGSTFNAGHGYGLTQNIGSSNTGFKTAQNFGLNNKRGSELNSGAGSKYGYGSNINSGSNIRYGPILSTGLNRGSTVNSDSNRATSDDSKNAFGSYPNSAYGSNLNDGRFTPVYPSSNDGISLTQPLLSTNTQGVQNYNSLPSNPTSTGFHSSQHHHEDSGAAGDDKVKIVDVPIKSGFGQSISLPLDRNRKYKVLHMNPNKNKIPNNVLTTLKQADTDVHNVLDTNGLYTIGSNRPNSPQITAPSEFESGAIDYSNQNDDKASLVSYNYGSKKNLPSNVYSTLIQADSQIGKALGEINNQKGTASTIDESQYDGVNNIGYNNLYNYQPYTTSNSQAQAGANSDTVKQGENKFYEINYDKDINQNNFVNTLTQAKLQLGQVLGENGEITKNQQGFSQNNPDTSSSILINEPYGNSQVSSLSYGNTQVPSLSYGNSQVPSLSYSNAQASANSGTLKQEGLNEYDVYSNKRIISNKEIDSLTLADIKIRSVLDAVEEGKIKDNQQSVQSSTFASSNASSTAAAGQYGQLSLYNNGHYYPGADTLQTYNQPFGYDHLAPSTSPGNSQATASASSSSVTQNGYYPQGNSHYPNYFPSKPTVATGVNQPHASYPPIGQHNGPQLNFTHNIPNKYNSFNHYNPHLNHPNYTSLNWQNYLNRPTSIQTNYGLNYPIRHAPPSNIDIGTQQYSTDTTKSTATASSNSESTSSILKFDYPNYNYNLYPHLNKDIDNRHPPIYGQNYGQQPNINQSPTTDSPVDDNAVQTDKSTIIENLQDSTTETIRHDRWNNVITDVSLLNINDGTQQSSFADTNKGIYVSNDYGNSEISKTESPATSDATASSSQIITTSLQQTGDNLGLYGQKYGDQSSIQSTDSPLDTATSSSSTIGNENRPDYTSTTYQINSNQESNNNINKMYNSYGSSTQTQSSTDNTNDSILYGGNNHKYSGVYGQYYGDQLLDIQITDSSVNENTGKNNPTNSGKYESNSPTNNLPSSLDDGNTQTQSPFDNTSYQEFTDYRSEEDKTNTKVDKTTIIETEDSSITLDDFPSDHNRHGGKHHHRHSGKHHKHHHHNQHKNTHPNYYTDKYAISLDQSSSYVNKHESTESKSETNYESYQSTENVPSANTDVSQTSSTNTGNDKTYLIDYSNEKNVASKEQSATVTDSQTETSVIINTKNGYLTNTNDNAYNQQTSNTYNNDGSSLNNQQINNNNYGNDKQTIVSINAGYDSDKTQKTTNANDYNYGYSEITKKSEQSVQAEETEQIKTTKNVQTSQVDTEEITEEDSSSSSTVIQEQGTVTKKQGQSSTACGSKGPGFAKIGTTINTKADGTSYSRAFEALLKILDSIEKIFLNQVTLE